MTDRERLVEELRPAAFAVAYRMLGSVAEVEDVVQEALLGCITRSRSVSGSRRRARSSPP